jgi:DNA-binding CsgD family transcriptional regulator
MATAIRDVTGSELRLFGDIVARLERLGPESDARAVIFMDVMRLLRSDFGASYVWNPRKSRCSASSLSFNMERSNLRRYEDWYQFRDPMTFELRTRRRATLVDDVIPREVLMRTEFYNDFLARDGLHHGVNMFIFDGDRDLGDFRIWRAQGRPDFCDRDLDLLDALEPYLRCALLRCADARPTPQSDVAALVNARLHRPDIARILGIGFGTVRTHITNAMSKTGCSNRAELAAGVARRSCYATSPQGGENYCAEFSSPRLRLLDRPLPFTGVRRRDVPANLRRVFLQRAGSGTSRRAACGGAPALELAASTKHRAGGQAYERTRSPSRRSAIGPPAPASGET